MYSMMAINPLIEFNSHLTLILVIRGWEQLQNTCQLVNYQPVIPEKTSNTLYLLLFSLMYVAMAKKSQPTLEKVWSNAKVEMRPPSTSDWPAIKKAFINLKDATITGRFVNVTVKEGVANTLVAVEIAMWFYVGEIIGRRSIIGYNV